MKKGAHRWIVCHKRDNIDSKNAAPVIVGVTLFRTQGNSFANRFFYSVSSSIAVINFSRPLPTLTRLLLHTFMLLSYVCFVSSEFPIHLFSRFV